MVEKYLLVLSQEGEGCDYTIGCGYIYKEITLPSDPENPDFTKILKEHTVEYYSSDENLLDKAFLIKMEHVQELPVQQWYWLARMSEKEQKELEQREKELKTLQYLKNKYPNV